jgi:hypothetical protein
MGSVPGSLLGTVSGVSVDHLGRREHHRRQAEWAARHSAWVATLQLLMFGTWWLRAPISGVHVLAAQAARQRWSGALGLPP